MNLRTPTSLLASALTPALAPISMPVRAIDAAPETRPLARAPGLVWRRLGVGLVAAGILGLLAWAMFDGLMRDGLQAVDVAIFGLFVPNVALNALAAATALFGLFWARKARRADPPVGWRPSKRTAILIPSRNEDVAALGQRIRALMRDIAARGFGAEVDVFLLSDSDDRAAIAGEERLAIEIACGEGRPRFYYRRRLGNEGRKVGNITNWLRQWGGHYAYMLTLDADSVMSARRIAAMIRRMETRPRLGLIQSGIRLSGGESRFARLQQRAGRLYGGPFIAGMAGWSGHEGNYYGHNALIRVAAFSGAAGLPTLPGAAPFGGDILSHDFIEAAWMRRAGWGIEIDPESVGSSEGGPETLMAYHKRDRRWCQGNLQHLRLLRARGLNPVSRLHLILGIAGYLAAPLWLALVTVAILAREVDGMLWPTLGAIALILVQKAVGVVDRLRRRRGAWARRIVLGAAWRELLLSTLLAPVVMLRQTVSVVSIVTGHDCGWKPPAGSKKAGDAPWLEPVAGAAMIAAVSPALAEPWHVLLVAPIALPLLVAPLVTAWLDGKPGSRLALPLPALPVGLRLAVQR